MHEWRIACAELRVIYDEKLLHAAGERLARALGFDSFVFGLGIPISRTRPIMVLHGAHHLIAPRSKALDFRDRSIRMLHATNEGVSWADAGKPVFWLDAFPSELSYGWSQPTRGFGSELGIACFARRATPYTALEADVNARRMLHLAQTYHAQVMHLIYAQLDVLSIRERDVLRFLRDGRTAQEIATSLGLKARTVDHYRYLLRDKTKRTDDETQALNATQAILWRRIYGIDDD